jgi:hypothetical protein
VNKQRTNAASNETGGNCPPNKKRMKNLNKILMAALVAAAFTTASRANADEPFLSPRAKANQIRVAPAGTSANDVNLVTNRPAGNAKAWAQAQSLRTVPSTSPTVDLAHGPRPTMSPKDPRYEQAARELRESQYQIAPLK